MHLQARTAVITGWAVDPGARFRYQCDAAFPLSDHADYDDLLRFVEQVNPQKVLTLHGFAEEFARTLRERGIEAWAVGRANQLELTLPSTAPAATRSLPTSSQPGEGAASSPAAPDDLATFATVAEQIKTRASKLEKINLLADYLLTLPTDAAATAILYFTGRPFMPGDPRTLNLGWAIIKRTLLDLTGLNEEDYRRTYTRLGDSGDVARTILAGHTQPAPAPLAGIATFFDAMAATRSPAAKMECLRTRLGALSPLAAMYLLKIISGDLRIGLKEGLVEEAIATATQRPVDAVRAANLLCGDLETVWRAARGNRLDQITLRVFHPLQFMLASPEPTAAALLARLGPPVWLEPKYDGIRCQLHKQGDRVELFSRDLKRITDQFPDLVPHVRALPGDFILDGELLAWRGNRALPFAELQKRLSRIGGSDFFLGEEIPVSVSAYDLLWLEGRTLLHEPLHTRRRALETLLGNSGPQAARVQIAPVTLAPAVADIEAAFLQARRNGNEGLLAKDPASAYTPGRRGLSWLKLKKAYATLDVVVIAAEYGHGKRKGMLSDYTFAVRAEASGELLAVGKAYSGLTDAEIISLTEHFIAHTLAEKGRRRVVVPNVVLEVAFDSIQRSDRYASGYSLRFPRITRIRTDKAPAEIDTLATCAKLAAADACAPPSRPPSY